MALPAQDSFPGGNSLNSLGANWTASLAGSDRSLSIVSNAAAVDAGDVNQDGANFWNADAFPDDQYSQAPITVTGTVGGGSGMGLCVRAAAGKTYYRLVIDHAAGNNVELARFVAGAFTQLWIRAANGFVNGDLLRLEVRTVGADAVLKALLNGVAIGADFTDTSPIASGAAGLSYSGGETAASADDWEGGSLAVSGGGFTEAEPWVLGWQPKAPDPNVIGVW